MDETLPTSDTPVARGVGYVVAGRYRLDAYLGRGGGGTVFRATDQVAGTSVAVKFLRDYGRSGARTLFRREIGLQRALRVPGVVQLLDDGEDGGNVFLVMDLAQGEPFPGGGFRSTWASLEPIATGLLETVRRLHVRGVVHRDLKPGNVLVDEHGHVLLLDFGLSVGPTLGDAEMTAGSVYGTPAYLAPEQVRGGPATGRTDLYAVGVLLYEALCDRLPHTARDLPTLIESKVSVRPPSVTTYRPDLPPRVSAVIDQLLAADPGARPASAQRVIEQIQGSTPPRSPGFARWIGPRVVVDAICRAAAERRSLDIVGPPGSGRTRALAEAESALVAAGVRVHRGRAGQTPYSSLPPFTSAAPADTEDLGSWTAQRLVEVLEDGVLLVDDAEDVDVWTREVLELARESAAIICARHTAGTQPFVALQRWSERELEAVFSRRSRFGRQAADAAAELMRRTGGLPAAVVLEVGAWVRAGVVRHDQDGLRVSAPALDRFRAGLDLPPPTGHGAIAVPTDADGELMEWLCIAWPNTTVEVLAAITGTDSVSMSRRLEDLVGRRLAIWDGAAVRPVASEGILPQGPGSARAHAQVARVLAPGEPGRLLHLVASDAAQEAADEALLVARTLRTRGALGACIEALAEGLHALRRGGGGDAVELLREWLLAALVVRQPHAIDRVIYELSRETGSSSAADELERLARATQQARSGGGARALELLESVGPLSDPSLERWRWILRLSAAWVLPIEQEEELFGEYCDWCETQTEPEVLVTRAFLEARLRYRQGRFDEAARCYDKAGGDDGDATVAASVAGAWMEALELDAARDAAQRARCLARDRRDAALEAKAEQLLRSIAYRAGEPLAADPAFVDDAAEIGMAYLEPLVALTEAGFAWRAGDLPLAQRLAGRAAKVWAEQSMPVGAMLCRALVAVSTPGACPEEIQAAGCLALEGDDLPRARAQVLGLLALALPPSVQVPEAWLETAVAWAAGVPADRWGCRLEVLSVNEALGALRREWSPRP